MPEPIGDQRNAIFTDNLLLGSEMTTDQGLYAEQRQDVRRGADPSQLLGLPLPGEAGAEIEIRPESLKTLIVLVPVTVFGE
jgi:hypothetical protein